MLAAAFLYESRAPTLFRLSSGYTADPLTAHELVVLVISSAEIPALLDHTGTLVLVDRAGLREVVVAPVEALRRAGYMATTET